MDNQPFNFQATKPEVVCDYWSGCWSLVINRESNLHIKIIKELISRADLIMF